MLYARANLYISNVMRRNGFTFLETIISITIFTVVIVAVYSAFNMGIKTWRRSKEQESLQKTRLAFLKMEKDIKNTFYFSKIKFTGGPEKIEFPLTVSGGPDNKGQVYKITYDVNTDEESGFSGLTRIQKIHSEDNEEVPKERELLSSMKSIGFEYAYESEDSFTWQNNWTSEKLPSGVRISVEAEDTEEIYSKVIFLQQGKLGSE